MSTRRTRADTYQKVNAVDLRVGDVVLVEAGDVIPGDGEIIEGLASVNESAITGESAPVIREAGGDRSAVTGGTTVLSDQIKVRITAAAGSTFIDRMIALVEGAERQKTPNELALSILLSGLTLIFPHRLRHALAARRLFRHGALGDGADRAAGLPDPDHDRRPALGDRHRRHGPSDPLQRHRHVRPRRGGGGRRRHAAARQDRHDHLRQPHGRPVHRGRRASPRKRLAEAVLLASLSDETPEGRSIVTLAKSRYEVANANDASKGAIVPFTAQTRISGVDLPGRVLRKGAVDAILAQSGLTRETAPAEFNQAVDRISRSGGTPLAVSDNSQLLGIIHLKDIVKPDIRPRFAELRAMGIKTVMVTGDNPLTAAAIASEAGVDDFLAQATPEDKLAYIRKEQQGGRLIAMCGDGTNDAPALAQADVGVAMQTGTQAAREAGNMVDLDSDPTKLIEIVGIGKQLLMTRGSLTTFSIANDVAKYFAIIPALFVTTYPELGALNVMGLHSDKSAILSAVIFNALIIIALIPLALKGVAYRPVGAAALLAAQPGHLRPRRHHRSLRRHQDHRRLDLRHASGLRISVMLSQIRPAIVLLVLFTLLTGLAYPLAITAIAQAILPLSGRRQPAIDRRQAGGVGADRPELSRPTNISMAGPRRPRLRIPRTPTIPRRRSTPLTTRPIRPARTSVRPRRSCSIASRRTSRRNAPPVGRGPVPADAVTTSASGLDPDISPENALAQIPAVAKARALPEDKLRLLVEANVAGRFLGLVGEPRVNVLELNMALDALKPTTTSSN